MNRTTIPQLYTDKNILVNCHLRDCHSLLYAFAYFKYRETWTRFPGYHGNDEVNLKLSYFECCARALVESNNYFCFKLVVVFIFNVFN